MSITLSGMAQYSENKINIRKDNKGMIRSVEYTKEDTSLPIPKSSSDFFINMLKIQTLDRFDRKMYQSDNKLTHESYDQYYNGVKVDGCGYTFHYYDGVMNFAHGHYIRIEGLNTKPAITVDGAKTSFSSYKKIPNELITNYQSELMIKEIPMGNDTLPLLVYRVSLFAEHPNNDEYGFLDAQTGKVVFTEPISIGSSALGTFETRYSGTKQSYTDYQSSTNNYRLYDNTRGPSGSKTIIRTLNLAGSSVIPSSPGSSFEITDNDNNWKATEHKPNNNDMGLDIHWAMQQIYDRLYNAHGKKSINDSALHLTAYIRESNGNGAYWNTQYSVACFGAGGADFLSLATVDVVAHEFGHGISDRVIKWSYSGNQAVFHEGLSDIWAAIMKYRITPNQPTWYIGNQIMKSSSYNCTRNLLSTNDSKAFTKMADTYNTTQYNSGSVYVKSGVFSHWFFTLVNGNVGYNGLGNSFTVHGIGMDNAEELIVKAVYGG